MNVLKGISYRDLLIVSLILLSACIIFHPFLYWLFRQYLFNPWSNHAIIVPIAALFILHKQKKRLDVAKEEGKAGLVVGIVLMAVSLVALYPQPSVLFKLGAFIMYIVGCSTFFYGTQILSTIIKPALYLLFMYPIFPSSLLTYGASLLTLTGRITFEGLKVLGLNPQYSETPLPVISLVSSNGEEMAFAIDVPCMGSFMLIGFVSFAAFLALVTEGSRLRKCFALSLGVLMAISLNILRVTVICIIGYNYGLELALQTFHLFGGWLLFAIGISIYITVNSKLTRIRLDSWLPRPKGAS